MWLQNQHGADGGRNDQCIFVQIRRQHGKKDEPLQLMCDVLTLMTYQQLLEQFFFGKRANLGWSDDGKRRKKKGMA